MNSEAANTFKFKKPRNDRAERLNGIFNYGTDTDGQKFAKCTLCENSKGLGKIIKMKNGNTSGIKRHIQSSHKEFFEEIYGENISLKQKV